MKVLYVARVYRWDQLWTIKGLARHMTKCCLVRYTKLMRCIAHMNPQMSVMHTYVNDPVRLCNVAVFFDAGFSCDTTPSSLTIAAYAATVGQNTWAPIARTCKDQHTLCHSSIESDIIALGQRPGQPRRIIVEVPDELRVLPRPCHTMGRYCNGEHFVIALKGLRLPWPFFG